MRPIVLRTLPLIAVFVLGALGFARLFHLGLGDALYATVVTITTLGDPSLHIVSGWQKTLVAAVSVVGVTFAIAAIAAIASENFSQVLEQRRVRLMYRELSGHVVVAGGGRVGRNAVEELLGDDLRVVVIERDRDLCERLRKDLEITVLTGDATDRDVLEQAKLGTARGFIAAMHDDAANLYAVILAGEINPQLQIVARGSGHKAVDMLRRSGAQRVVLPETIAGHRLARAIAHPVMLKFFDDGAVEEVEIGPSSSACRKTLAELGRLGMQATVVAVMRDGRLLTSLSRDTAVLPGDVLLLVGEEQEIRDALVLLA